MAEQQHHEHGKMDTTEQEQTFAGFIRVITISVVIIAIILIFLAMVNA